MEHYIKFTPQIDDSTDAAGLAQKQEAFIFWQPLLEWCAWSDMLKAQNDCSTLEDISWANFDGICNYC
jgi:hypothetical protein